MRRVATALVTGMLLGDSVAQSVAVPRRPGKIVRVARTEPDVSTLMRVCQLYDIDLGSCSRAVAVDDLAWLVDSEGTYGQVRIRTVTPTVDNCGMTTAWQVSIDNSQVLSRDYSYNAVLVLDHPITPSGRVLPTTESPVGERPGEVLLYAIDADGDDHGDVQITTFPCDERGTAGHAYGITHQCTEYWLKHRDRWRSARTDAVATCQR